MRHSRAAAALMGETWALEPGKMEQVAEFAQALIEGRATRGEVFASLAGEGGGESRPYTLTEEGVAVIPVSGVIARRLNLFSAISGGCSTELLGRQVRKAAADPAARAIVLDIDSPGGGVFGLSDLTETIRAAGQIKPVVAFSAELMCSAAYWIGSAANEMMCTLDAQVGSIGVAAMHFDYSRRDEAQGVRRTVLFAGEYKRIASDEKPLSDEGRDYLQARVDHYYALFVEAVAVNRGMSVEDVLAQLADGATHIGNEAAVRGFVNSVGNMESAVARALELADARNNMQTQEADMPGTTPKGAGADSGGSGLMDLSAMTAEQLTQANPDLAAELYAHGVNAERQRVVDLMAAGADPEATASAVRDGIAPADFYRQALAAERTGRAEKLKAFEERLGESAGQDGQAVSAVAGDDFDALVKAHMEEAECSKGKAILAVARKNPELHAAWLAGQK
ncbi:S49 family peptidase [Pseudodesulfovibrio pelocollis]|uniref:S49 family peptidase n=1 Tax=Pseudodesulfovibrio pelocollis TaxID=3051432 RepID=UPI00255A82D5|nr:S49 family peptidase [Pseudodesulfovibrio sp. SB368]